MTLKQVIKDLAARQSGLKNQRKTIYIVGERKMTAKEAALLHMDNRDRLMHLYIAYAILRGADSDCCRGEDYSQRRIDKIVEQFKENIK